MSAAFRVDLSGQSVQFRFQNVSFDGVRAIVSADVSQDINARAAKAANLSDLADPDAARANIGAASVDVETTVESKYPLYNAQSGTGTALAKLNAQIVSAGTGGQVWNPSPLLVGGAPTNDVGARVEGAPVYYASSQLSSLGNSTGRRVVNLPGRDPALLHYGIERLFPAFHRIRNNAGLKIVLIGDSNTEGYAGPRIKALLEAELPNATVYNYGVSGSTPDMFLAGTGLFAAGQAGAGKDLSAVQALNAHLIIDGYGGTNDPAFGRTAAQFLATKDSIYTALRSAAPDRLAIVSCTSAMMNDGTGSGPEYRDQLFNAKVRDGIRALCEKHTAAFFDKNGIAPDAFVEAATASAQNYNLDSARVHTQNDLTEHIAQSLLDFLLPPWFRSATHNTAQVTPASGFTLPASEKMFAVKSGDAIVGGGYVSMTTPATLTLGQTIATLPNGYAPFARAIAMAALFNSGASPQWEYNVPLQILSDGTITAGAASTQSPERVYLVGAWATVQSV